MGRRAFLLAGTAAGLAWLAPGTSTVAFAQSSSEHADELPIVRLPRLTENGAKVPIVVDVSHPMDPAHHVTSVRVVNDRDPLPSKGEFYFSPANGSAYLAFQARLDEGRSAVRVGVACSHGQEWSSAGSTMVATGGGGCAGAAPAPGQRGVEIRPPAIRLPHLVRGTRLEPGEIIDVQVKVKHPVRTGLGLREGRFVPVTEPFYLSEMDVLYRDRRVSRFVMTPAVADDPLITFRLRPEDEGLLRVVFRNSRGAVLDATHAIRFG